MKTTETTIRTDLIRQLANHLLHGKLAHQKFNFRAYNIGSSGENICGTAGCMLGEAPAVWPDKWKWYFGTVLLTQNCSGDEFKDAIRFFNINDDQFCHLFIPNGQNHKWGETLPIDATKEAVALNALKFCELVEAGEIK